MYFPYVLSIHRPHRPIAKRHTTASQHPPRANNTERTASHTPALTKLPAGTARTQRTRAERTRVPNLGGRGKACPTRAQTGTDGQSRQTWVCGF